MKYGTCRLGGQSDQGKRFPRSRQSSGHRYGTAELFLNLERQPTASETAAILDLLSAQTDVALLDVYAKIELGQAESSWMVINPRSMS